MDRKERVTAFKVKLEETFQKRTPKSREMIAGAAKYVPGGDFRSSVWYGPYPVVMEKGLGCRLFDVDGNDYLDCSNNWTSMVLGNNHPAVVKAISEQAQAGSAMAAPFHKVYEWAKIMCDRVASVDRVRFSTSGTEAVMMAVRVARAFTGKDKILKMEGCYHGSYDPMEMTAGWRRVPPGVPRSVEQDLLTVPFNDKDAAEKAIRENKNELAAVIVEGVMGAAGMIPPENDYLNFLKETAAANDVLLIIDEVISFRLAPGGAQEVYGVTPDLTAFGKTIGGGLPAGAFGGREDIMALLSPKGKPHVHQAGTFMGTPIGVQAGIAGLKGMTPAELDRINGLGNRVAEQLRGILDDLKLNIQVKGYGSLQQLHFTPEPVSDAATALFTQDRDLVTLFHKAMLNRNMFIGSRGFFSVSTPMTEKEIDLAMAAAAESLEELKPLIQDIAPKMIN